MGRRWMAILFLVTLCGCGGSNGGGSAELLNVSYDPTRELWRDLNAAFIPQYEKETGTRLTIRQSHGGSGTQARAVIDGLEADVVTLALWSDTDAIRQKGLIQPGWEKRLPDDSLPYHSTIVFVVRRGNPKAIKDWKDLTRPDVRIITPNPKTSGNGKLSFLAAWGSVIAGGGDEAAARAYMAAVYRRVPVLDSGARGATATFAQKKIGDVHLTWENEAYLEVEEAKGELELVYPPASIRAEPPVAVVDATVDRKGSRAAAEAYLRFLYTPAGQAILAKHHYRPRDPEAGKQAAQALPEPARAGYLGLRLFPITTVTPGGWGQVQEKFFAEGAIFDQLYQPR